MTTQPTCSTDVLIVGAGPAGLALACELLRRGLRCRIIDKAAAPASTSRALGFQPRTLEVFDNMGILDEVMRRGGPIFGASFYEGEQMLFTIGGEALQKLVQRNDVPYPYPWIMPQSDIESLLNDWLERLGGAVERGCELVDFHEEAQAVVANVNTASGPQTIRASWLAGCDGAHSLVRRTLGIAFEGSTYEEHFLLADLDMDWSRGRDKTHTWFHPSGMFVAIPFPGTQRWRLFADLTAAKGEAIPEVTLELFQRLLRERTGDGVTRLSNPSWMSNFTSLNRRMVNRYRAGRVFLAGDAAHIHSPFGGQGMNTGIQDAFNLGWKLAQVTTGSAPAELLDTYDAERRPVAEGVLRQTDDNTKVILSKSPIIKLLRERVLPLEAFQKFILRRASELDVNYRQSWLSVTSPSLLGLDGLRYHFAPRAGDRAPQGYGQAYPSGQKMGLFEAWRGTAWHLVLLGGVGRDPRRNAELAALARRAEALRPGSLRALLIFAAGGQPAGLDWNGQLLLDPQRALHTQYGAGDSAIYLIRPDGYIGFRGQPAAEGPVMDYLGKVLAIRAAESTGPEAVSPHRATRPSIAFSRTIARPAAHPAAMTLSSARRRAASRCCWWRS